VPIDPQLLEPYDRLISVTIEGRQLRVPENNSLLRVLQYLDVDLYPCRLCWNGDCDNCRFVYVHPKSGMEATAKACAPVVKEGMVIRRLPALAVWPRKTSPRN
jgi:predicted molibdopterin-dependent oxidoreductase YjgC